MNMPKTYSAHIFELGCMDQRVYLQDEADAVIDKLKTEHHKERHEYINMVHSREQTIKELEAKLAKQESEKRRLSRALYKACANWALSTLAWLDCIDQGEPRKWSEMVQKCRAMAERYKEGKLTEKFKEAK